MRIGFPSQINPGGVSENLLIEVCRCPTQGKPAIGRDAVAAKVGLYWANPPDVSQWHEGPEKFFGGEDAHFGFLSQSFQIFRMMAEILNDRRNCMNDRIASSGKCQISKSHHLGAIEGAIVNTGLMKG